MKCLYLETFPESGKCRSGGNMANPSGTKIFSKERGEQDMRTSGILMHITSLPGPHGVGTLGKNAYAFVDFLEEAGQSYWQILPLTPTGYGDSPYQSCSTFAGNHYLIDLDSLVEAGLLKTEELKNITWCSR